MYSMVKNRVLTCEMPISATFLVGYYYRYTYVCIYESSRIEPDRALQAILRQVYLNLYLLSLCIYAEIFVYPIHHHCQH